MAPISLGIFIFNRLYHDILSLLSFKDLSILGGVSMPILTIGTNGFASLQ
jgi:hypothetical protein